MRDPNDIIADATYPCVKVLADREYMISLSAMYKKISEGYRYRELCELIQKLGRHNPNGVLLIQAHFNSICEMTLKDMPSITVARLNDEITDVTRATLHCLPIPDQKKEINEAIAALQARLKDLEQQEQGKYPLQEEERIQ